MLSRLQLVVLQLDVAVATVVLLLDGGAHEAGSLLGVLDGFADGRRSLQICAYVLLFFRLHLLFVINFKFEF